MEEGVSVGAAVGVWVAVSVSVGMSVGTGAGTPPMQASTAKARGRINRVRRDIRPLYNFSVVSKIILWKLQVILHINRNISIIRWLIRISAAQAFPTLFSVRRMAW